MTLSGAGNLGIGTTSPSFALDVSQSAPRIRQTATTGTNSSLIQLVNSGGTAYVGLDSSSGGLTSAYSLNMYHSGAYPITFSTSGTERMRLDSAGNLGLGFTPSAWFSFTKALQLNYGAFAVNASVGHTRILNNAVETSSIGYVYQTTNPANNYTQALGSGHQWFIAPSGTAGNPIVSRYRTLQQTTISFLLRQVLGLTIRYGLLRQRFGLRLAHHLQSVCVLTALARCLSAQAQQHHLESL